MEALKSIEKDEIGLEKLNKKAKQTKKNAINALRDRVRKVLQFKENKMRLSKLYKALLEAGVTKKQM